MATYRKRGCKCCKYPKDKEHRKNCKCKCKPKCEATWSFRIELPRDPASNKRNRPEFYGFKTKADAIKAATDMLDRINKGTYIEESYKTFGEFAYEWLNLYQSTGNVKVSTVRIRKHEISRLMDYLKYIKLKEIDLDLYQKTLNELKKRGYAHQTISGAHSTGRMIFQEALKREYTRKDPTQFAYIPKDQVTVEQLEQQEEIPKYLEKDQLKLFLETANSKGLEGDYPIFLTLAYSGLRVGELCALKWSDFDEEEMTLSVTKTYYNPRNVTTEYQLLTPKTTSARRVTDIDEDLCNELNRHKARQKELKMEFRKHWHDENFIFARSDLYAGYPQFVKTIENRMRRLLKHCGLDTRLTPHSLRHTHTSLLAEAGVSLEEIMTRLGHKNDEVTRNIYLHITKTRKKEAVQKFRQLMKSI